MSDLYRLTKTQMVEGSMHAMNGGTYMGHLVPVSIDYEAAELPILDMLAMQWSQRSGTYDEWIKRDQLKEMAYIMARAVVDAALRKEER